MSALDYTRGMQHPELVKLCNECEQPDCPDGLCDAYRNKWREIHGKPPVRRPKKRTRLGKYEMPLEAFGEVHYLAEWSELYGIRYNTLYQRINRSRLSLEDALKLGGREGKTGKEPKRYAYDGKSLTIWEWHLETGIAEETIRARMSRGWCLADVLSRPLKKRRRKP